MNNNIIGYALDKEQIEVVKSNDSHILVIAGAGAGKSLTIIGKIRYLIEVLHYKEWEILCISFTNEATNSLKSKLKVNYNYDINVLTFHKLALKIINSHKRVEVIQENYLKDLIEDFINYTIYDNHFLIKCVLKYYNIRYSNNNYLKRYKRLITTININKIKKTIYTFISLFKSNNNDINDLKTYIKKSFKTKDYYFLLIAYAVYLMYQQELHDMDMIDFDDMINKSIKLVKKSDLQYKYIIVDEYQDTSKSKVELLKELIKYTNAKLMAVGDDWQSIYRFTGCSLNMFLNFTDYFKNSTIMHLNHTYRNSQELIDVAGRFIMKNNKQIKKELIAIKHIFKPIKLCYYKNERDDFSKLIFNLYDKGSLLILGRNNFDIYRVLNQNIFKINNDNISFWDKRKTNIRFLTIHKSKGLESDNVIIINLKNDLYGLPCKLEDEKVLKYVKEIDDNIPFEEERRLFYVALTRSKNNVYLFVPKIFSSLFIKELKKNNKKHIEKINLQNK